MIPILELVTKRYACEDADPNGMDCEIIHLVNGMPARTLTRNEVDCEITRLIETETNIYYKGV